MIWYIPTLCVELPAKPIPQVELQLGVRDAAVLGLYLREHDGWTGTTGVVHQRGKRRSDQPNPRESHRVLSGTLP